MSKFFKLILIALFIGLVSGILSSSFLHLLNYVTALRQRYPFLIYGLPLYGIVFAFTIKKVPHHINQGVPYILEEIDNDKAHVSPWMTPFIFLSSLGTHLFGGSAGREGVGVIMGASAGHLLPLLNSQFKNMRRYLIYSGIAAGISSIFGTPVAGIVFAFELHAFLHVKQFNLLLCTIVSSFIALIIPHFFGPLHMHFKVFISVTEIVPYLFISGVVSGLGAIFFYWGYKGYTILISHFFPHLAVKLGVGGLLISVLVFFTHSYDYIGLGTDIIAKSFISEMSYFDFAMKALLTIMTISIGFKGGEVTPLFFMGSTLSNWACSLLSFRNFSLSSALGMVGLFGAVTGTPLASAVMGVELFGWKVGLVCFGTCFIAKIIMGERSVYRH